ncbi:helix-turn-helix transcriptional regulator [Phytomonospora sp. NPDC050363]|uniref:helix-turn-helix domain-containing protein n=1 Tax=Phytomonospora sp. NPDC050363 TaxID=3155642 RepID=UPI0033C70BAC
MPRRKQAQNGSPTVAARLLANELRQLRTRAGLSQADVARELGCTPGRVGHMETRRNQPRRSDLLVMLQMYKVPAERQVWYLDLAAKAKEKGWWDGAEGIPEWFTTLIGLEWGASQIRTYELGLVPGLLQTADYMAALFEVDSPGEDELIAKFIEHRMRRQDPLHRTQNPLSLHAILDQAVINRVVREPGTMRGQLEHLLAMSDHPHVTVQILPFEAGPHPGFGGGFHCIDFAEADDSGVIYLETRCGGLYLEEETEVAEYHSVFERLATMALTPSQTKEMLEGLRKDM